MSHQGCCGVEALLVSCTSPCGFGRAATLASGAMLPAGTGRPQEELSHVWHSVGWGVCPYCTHRNVVSSRTFPPTLTSRICFLFQFSKNKWGWLPLLCTVRLLSMTRLTQKHTIFIDYQKWKCFKVLHLFANLIFFYRMAARCGLLALRGLQKRLADQSCAVLLLL